MMRILVLETVHPVLARQFVRWVRPEYAGTYAEAHAAFKRARASPDYEAHLGNLGHEVAQIFVNVEPLQRLWADEAGVTCEGEGWQWQLITEQTRQFSPDVLYLHDLNFFDRARRAELRDVCRSRMRIVGWHFSLTRDFGAFRDLDLVLTGSSGFADLLRNAGVRAEVLHHAVEASVLSSNLEDLEGQQIEFSFAGTAGGRNSWWARRYALIESLMRETPLEVWGTDYEAAPRSQSDRILDAVAWAGERMLRCFAVPERIRRTLPVARRAVGWVSPPWLRPVSRQYAPRWHPPVYGIEFVSVLRRSKITLNVHGDLPDGHAGNVRLFQATGCGACLVTDDLPGLEALFAPDSEVVTYTTAAECAERVRFLLEHDSARAAIAAAGQARTLKDHTWHVRSQQLAGIISRIL